MLAQQVGDRTCNIRQRGMYDIQRGQSSLLIHSSYGLGITEPIMLIQNSKIEKLLVIILSKWKSMIRIVIYVSMRHGITYTRYFSLETV